MIHLDLPDHFEMKERSRDIIGLLGALQKTVHRRVVHFGQYSD